MVDIQRWNVVGRGVAIGLALVLSPLFAVPSHSQPVANSNEIQVSGGFFHAQGSDTGTLTADVSYGRFLSNPALQVGFRQGLLILFTDGPGTPWLGVSTPFFNYHFLGLFQDNRVVPFLGISAGAVWNDDDFTGTLGPQAGGKFFLSNQTFLQLAYRYEWFFEELDRANNESDDGNHVVSVGLGFLW